MSRKIKFGITDFVLFFFKERNERQNIHMKPSYSISIMRHSIDRLQSIIWSNMINNNKKKTMKIHKHTHAVSLQINQLDFKQNVVFVVVVVVQDFISEYCLSYDDYTGLANLITQSRKFCTIEIKRMKTKKK